MRQRKGFTLTELIVILAVLVIVGGIVYYVISPTQRLAQSRNDRRLSEVNSILNAVIQYSVDNNGKFPPSIDDDSGTSQIIGSDKSGCDSLCPAAGQTAASCADLQADLVPKYLAAVPQDPQKGSASKTLYYINKTANGRILVGACLTELGQTISAQK